jgi:hypothetical protein
MKKLPLAVRAQNCSFIGMGNKPLVSNLIKEISSSKNEKALLETISMPLMDSIFIELALSRLMAIKLSHTNAKESITKIKISKKVFPKEILERFPEDEQVEIPLGKVILRGDYLFIFISSNGFIDNVVRFILESSDYFTKN